MKIIYLNCYNHVDKTVMLCYNIIKGNHTLICKGMVIIMKDEIIYKIAEVLKNHDKHNPFTAEGIKIIDNNDIDVVEHNADFNLPAWDSADYYANFLGIDVKVWCDAIDIDYTTIKKLVAEMSFCSVNYITDYDIKEYIIKEYEKEVLDLICDVIDEQTADYINSAESYIEMYEELQREVRRNNE